MYLKLAQMVDVIVFYNWAKFHNFLQLGPSNATLKSSLKITEMLLSPPQGGLEDDSNNFFYTL